MNLLEKLEKVEIQITDKFPAEDMEYCRKREGYYKNAYAIYDDIVTRCREAIEKINKLPSQKHVKSLDNNVEVVHSCNNWFIGKICSYFRDKYKISINAPEWENVSENDYGRKNSEPKYEMIPLQYILDSIFEQMGGMSFEEKAFAELKEDAREAVTSYKGKSKYRIQGTKLIIEDFYCSYKCRIWKRYKAGIEKKHRAFFKALTHFEYDYYDLARKYGFLFSRYELNEEDGVYDRHLISSSVITAVKVFKNGKLEVEFVDYATAVRFMETYFPGIPQQEKTI